MLLNHLKNKLENAIAIFLQVKYVYRSLSV